MRIYTEEHVREAIELARYTHLEGRAYTQTEEYDYSDDEVVDLLIPIELPSDQEIQKESKFKSNHSNPQAVQFNPALNIVWVEGAIWMRDRIKGGNK